MRTFGWTGLALLFLCAGCGDGGTGPTKRAQIQLVSGNALSDTVDAPLSQPLIVVVHDSTGAVVPLGTVVRFQTGPVIDTASGQSPSGAPPTAFVEGFTSNTFDVLATGTTDASGRTGVMVKLGMHAGPASVVVTVPTLGIIDTARFTVQPGAAST
ncbi:MAG TPA: hypothetical protein VNU46_04310, partial [Gemmatimonadaceae bacterium]|nr:hypothetical protein [Gemmatimonadaceae bacterium]